MDFSCLVSWLLCLCVVSSVVQGCQKDGKSSKKQKNLLSANAVRTKSSTTRNKRFATYQLPMDQIDDISLEKEFLEFDENKDGYIDACEWLKTPDVKRNNSLREFVRLLDLSDLDEDDRLSVEEFVFMITITRQNTEIQETMATRSQRTGDHHFVDDVTSHISKA